MEILRCLMLPIYGKTLIVPYSAVAEVVVFSEAEVFSKSKTWILGEFNWRSFNIPLVCLEMLDENTALNMKPYLHVAVFNRMLEGNYPDFIGVVLQGVPIMGRYKHSDIEFVANAKEPYLLMEVKVRGKAAFIPNLAFMDEKLANFKGLSAAS